MVREQLLAQKLHSWLRVQGPLKMQEGKIYGNLSFITLCTLSWSRHFFKEKQILQLFQVHLVGSHLILIFSCAISKTVMPHRAGEHFFAYKTVHLLHLNNVVCLSWLFQMFHISWMVLLERRNSFLEWSIIWL